MNKMKIIVVFKTHFDIGFTALAREIVADYSTKMLDDVLNVCEATQKYGDGKRFVWTMASWPLVQTLAHAAPERIARAEALARDGQLLGHALPYTTHTEFMGYEELCRVFAYSKQFCDAYGLKYPLSAKMTDVPGHTRFLPTLLAAAGVKFLHLGCNSACRPPAVPPLYWWEGPDGARVLTMYNTTYGSGVLPPEGWKYPVWLAMRQTNDNTGPQGEAVVAELERTIAESGLNAEFRVGTMDDFYREIARCDLSALPVVRQDLADTWIHGVASYPLESAVIRRNRSDLAAYESLCAGLGRDADAVNAAAGRAYEAAQLYGEHTWGLDVKTTLGYNRVYDKKSFEVWRKTEAPLRLEESWDEQRARAAEARRGTEELKRIADGAGEARLFNALGRACEAYVETDVAPNGLRACGKVYAKYALPPFASVRAEDTLLPDAVAVTDDTRGVVLENEFLRLAVDRASGKVEFTDLRTGKVWISGALEYYYDVVGTERIWRYLKDYCVRVYDWAVNDLGRMGYPDDTQDRRFVCRIADVAAVGAGVRVRCQTPPESVSEFGNAAEVTVDYCLLGDRLHIEVKLGGKVATPYVENGNFRLPLNAVRPRYRINKVGGVVDPARDIARGANHNNYCLEDWVEAREGGDCLVVVSRDAPLFAFGDEQIYRTDDVYRRRRPELHFNLFNNMWGGNFPQWTEGDYTFAFDLIPCGKSSRAATAAAYALAHPPVPYSGDGRLDGFSVRGAELVSVRQTKSGLRLRLRNTDARARKVTVRGSLGSTVTPRDLYDRPLSAPIAVVDGRVALTLPPYGLATLSVDKNGG